MVYAFTQDMPGDAEIYQQVKEALGAEPAGMIARVVIANDHGLRHLQVWESQETWERYRDDHVAPAVAEVLARLGIRGNPHNVRLDPVELVDLALGPGSR